LLARKYRVIAPDLLGHGQSDKPRGDYSVGAFAVLLRDLLDALDVSRVTVVGHSLGGGIAMQFAHQHRQYCERIVLISSGGFGGDVGRVLRLLSLPGSELVLPVIASRPAVLAGNAVRALMGSSDRFKARPSLSNRDNRQAFLRTLRSVVDFRGQAVSALNRLCFHGVLPALINQRRPGWGHPGRARTCSPPGTAEQSVADHVRCSPPFADGTSRGGGTHDRPFRCHDCRGHAARCLDERLSDDYFSRTSRANVPYRSKFRQKFER